jgi:hypothetical protein
MDSDIPSLLGNDHKSSRLSVIQLWTNTVESEGWEKKHIFIKLNNAANCQLTTKPSTCSLEFKSHATGKRVGLEIC